METKNIQYKNTEKFTPEVIEEVLEVQEKFGLTAETLLKKASKKSSSLYEFFDWDNTSAGEKWRLQQARQVINEIKIVVEDREIYAFESVNISLEDRKPSNKVQKCLNQREYLPIIEIMNNEEYREQLIKRALIEANYWKEKHSELIELTPIFSSIKEISKKWRNKK